MEYKTYTDHIGHMNIINITHSGQDQDHHGQTLSNNTVDTGIPFNLGKIMVTVTKGTTVVIKVMTLVAERKTVVIKVTEVHDFQGLYRPNANWPPFF